MAEGMRVWALTIKPYREVLRMHQFMVFEHPVQKRIALKVGLSWPAFFLALFFSSLGCIVWFLYHRLWRYAGLWFVFLVVFVLLENAVRTSVADSSLQFMLRVVLLGVFFVVSMIPAFKGSAWRAGKLLSLGYAQVATVSAATAADALSVVAQKSSSPSSQ